MEAMDYRKALWRIAIVAMGAVLMICLFGACSNPGNQPSPSSSSLSGSDASSIAEPSSSAAQSTSNDADAEQFVSDVQSAIQGDINTSNGESITGVELKYRILLITVDISSTTVPDNFLIEDVAANRASAITSDVLKLDQYDDLWDTVTIDFGDVGRVMRAQSEAKENGFGRYFDIDYTSIVK